MTDQLEHRDTPLVGFRAWVLKHNMRANPRPEDIDHEPGLHSVAMQTTWSTDITSASCMARVRGEPPKHEAPHEGCRCGLHARTTLDGVKEEYPYYPIHGYWAYMSTPANGLMCMGAVLMWGTIMYGARVIRSEFARVICLTDPDPLWVEKVGNNNPQTVPEDRREQRERELEMVARRYGVPIIPYQHARAYSAEFGELCKPD